jgi:translation elongation factor EF-1beta
MKRIYYSNNSHLLYNKREPDNNCLFEKKTNPNQIYNTDFIRDKKLITISPGGYRGFYMMGICKFLRDNYNLDDYIFSGASAGSWISLLLCFKGNLNNIEEYLIDSSIQNEFSVRKMENEVKNRILKKYTIDDFDLRRLFIGITTIKNMRTNKDIISNFDNLEDAIDCCIASSHIPFITGGFRNIYREKDTFDGGFSKYPYLNDKKPILHITPYLFEKQGEKRQTLKEYTTLLSKNHYNFLEMIKKGYKNSLENKDYIDKLFSE